MVLKINTAEGHVVIQKADTSLRRKPAKQT